MKKFDLAINMFLVTMLPVQGFIAGTDKCNLFTWPAIILGCIVIWAVCIKNYLRSE